MSPVIKTLFVSAPAAPGGPRRPPTAPSSPPALRPVWRTGTRKSLNGLRLLVQNVGGILVALAYTPPPYNGPQPHTPRFVFTQWGWARSCAELRGVCFHPAGLMLARSAPRFPRVSPL